MRSSVDHGAAAGRYIFWIMTWNLPAGMKRGHQTAENIASFWAFSWTECTCGCVHAAWCSRTLPASPTCGVKWKNLRNKLWACSWRRRSYLQAWWTPQPWRCFSPPGWTELLSPGRRWRPDSAEPHRPPSVPPSNTSNTQRAGGSLPASTPAYLWGLIQILFPRWQLAQ